MMLLSQAYPNEFSHADVLEMMSSYTAMKEAFMAFSFAVFATGENACCDKNNAPRKPHATLLTMWEGSTSREKREYGATELSHA